MDQSTESRHCPPGCVRPPSGWKQGRDGPGGQAFELGQRPREKVMVPKDPLWSDILEFLDVQAPYDAPELAFQDPATMRSATLSGMGIGLISRIDAEHDIRVGDLVAPLGGDVLRDKPPGKVRVSTWSCRAGTVGTAGLHAFATG